MSVRIFGLNIGSNANMPNGRGLVDPDKRRFQYLPIVEDKPLRTAAPTYRDLGFEAVARPDLPTHLDPEFETFTYGHVQRFGDRILWTVEPGELLFFYATLDLAPDRKQWAIFIVGFFEIAESMDAEGKTTTELDRLKAYRANAHLKRVDAGVSLLMRGTSRSRLYAKAFPLSDLNDPFIVNPDLQGRITTVTGKLVTGGQGWWRWLLCSEDRAFARRLQNHL